MNLERTGDSYWYVKGTNFGAAPDEWLTVIRGGDDDGEDDEFPLPGA